MLKEIKNNKAFLKKKIKDYCKNNNITKQEFSEKIGYKTYRSLHYCLKPNLAPNWTIMANIILETKGEILPNDFFEEVIDYTKKEKI